jgi:adenylosuccinate synthase
VTEDPTLEFPESHNRHGTWQGAFRSGHFDAVALRYAAEVSGGVDAVALTHLDAARPDAGGQNPLRVCWSYQIEGERRTRIVPGPEHDLAWQERLTGMLMRARPVYEPPRADWPDVAGEVLGAPVALASYGPAAADKRLLVPALRAG